MAPVRAGGRRARRRLEIPGRPRLRARDLGRREVRRRRGGAPGSPRARDPAARTVGARAAAAAPAGEGPGLRPLSRPSAGRAAGAPSRRAPAARGLGGGLQPAPAPCPGPPRRRLIPRGLPQRPRLCAPPAGIRVARPAVSEERGRTLSPAPPSVPPGLALGPGPLTCAVPVLSAASQTPTHASQIGLGQLQPPCGGLGRVSQGRWPKSKAAGAAASLGPWESPLRTALFPRDGGSAAHTGWTSVPGSLVWSGSLREGDGHSRRRAPSEQRCGGCTPAQDKEPRAWGLGVPGPSMPPGKGGSSGSFPLPWDQKPPPASRNLMGATEARAAATATAERI
nr:translation initiation factor IF-2-like [Chlorocebus sabaeus]